MEDNTLEEKVAKLPSNLKLKVSEFVDSLMAGNPEIKGEKNKPVFGSGKGMFIIKPNFDEPLEDFKDYM